MAWREKTAFFYNWNHLLLQYAKFHLFLHILLALFIRVEVWHLLVCHAQWAIYWCAMGSVASNGVPCVVWNLLVCHVQCGIYWCTMCSVASIGVTCATNFNLTCFRTRFATTLQVLLLLYFKDSTCKLTYHTVREEVRTNGLYVTVYAFTPLFFLQETVTKCSWRNWEKFQNSSAMKANNQSTAVPLNRCRRQQTTDRPIPQFALELLLFPFLYTSLHSPADM
jgi:hypothetical protein